MCRKHFSVAAIGLNQNDICSGAVNFQLRDDFSKFFVEIKRFPRKDRTIWKELRICYVKQTLRIRHVGCLNNLQYHLFASLPQPLWPLSFVGCRIKLES